MRHKTLRLYARKHMFFSSCLIRRVLLSKLTSAPHSWGPMQAMHIVNAMLVCRGPPHLSNVFARQRRGRWCTGAWLRLQLDMSVCCVRVCLPWAVCHPCAASDLAWYMVWLQRQQGRGSCS
jgi:hypothetical protein